LKSCIEGIHLLEKGKTEEEFWSVTKKEGRGFLKMKFHARVILSFWGVTRITQGVIKKTLKRSSFKFKHNIYFLI